MVGIVYTVGRIVEADRLIITKFKKKWRASRTHFFSESFTLEILYGFFFFLTVFFWCFVGRFPDVDQARSRVKAIKQCQW